MVLSVHPSQNYYLKENTKSEYFRIIIYSIIVGGVKMLSHVTYTSKVGILHIALKLLGVGIDDKINRIIKLSRYEEREKKD
jgi:hypothetical protein